MRVSMKVTIAQIGTSARRRSDLCKVKRPPIEAASVFGLAAFFVLSLPNLAGIYSIRTQGTDEQND